MVRDWLLKGARERLGRGHQAVMVEGEKKERKLLRVFA